LKTLAELKHWWLAIQNSTTWVSSLILHITCVLAFEATSSTCHAIIVVASDNWHLWSAVLHLFLTLWVLWWQFTKENSEGETSKFFPPIAVFIVFKWNVTRLIWYSWFANECQTEEALVSDFEVQALAPKEYNCLHAIDD
jgi:hypothetical protein